MDEYFKQLGAQNPAIEAFEQTQTELKAEFAAQLNAALDKIDMEFERQRGRQAAPARTISRLSPVSCFVHVLTELAGTGFVEESAWQETRSRFRHILDRDVASKQQSFAFKGITYSGFGKDEGKDEAKAPAPKLPADPVPLEKQLAAVWIDLVLLVIYRLMFFAGACVAFLRYDVR
jgi:hypothetical protein